MARMEQAGGTPGQSRLWQVLGPIGWLVVGIVLAQLAWNYLHPEQGIWAALFCAFVAYLVLRAVQVVLIMLSTLFGLVFKR